MNAEAHANEAERLSELADGLDGLRCDTPEYAIVTALGSLTHAVLSLRPDPLLVTPATVQIGEAAPLAEGEDVDAEAAPVAGRMHVFGEDDGPTVTLTLPRDVALSLLDAVRVHVPASTGIDGAFLDEVRAQLADQS